MLKVSIPSTTEDDTEEKLNEKKVHTYGLTTQDIHLSSAEPTDLISLIQYCVFTSSQWYLSITVCICVITKHQGIDLNPKTYPLEG